MKKSLLILIVLTTSFIGQAQGQVQTLTLDFKDKDFKNLNSIDTLKPGDYYRLKVTSINMNLWKISIISQDTMIVPDITLPSSDIVNLGGVGDMLSKLSVKAISLLPIASAATTDNITKKLSEGMVKDFMMDKIGFYSVPEEEYTEFPTENTQLTNSQITFITTEIINKAIKDNLDTLKANFITLNNLNREIDSLSNSIQNSTLGFYVLNKEDENYLLLNKGMNFKHVLFKIDSIRTEIKETIKTIENQQAKYIHFKNEETINKIISENKDLTEADENLLTSYDTILASSEQVYKSIDAGNINKWLSPIVHLQNNDDFSYTSLPMRVNGNHSKLEIKIEPRKEEFGLPIYSTKIEFPMKQRTYVGIGASFYGGSLHDENYSVRGVIVDSVTTNYNIIKEKSSGEIGLATLLHFGWRPSTKKDIFALNFVVGPALSLSNPVKPRISLGGGLSFGRKQMLTVNGLFMAGPIDRQSVVYNENQTYSGKPENTTISQIGMGWGISIGYIYKF